MKVNITYWNDRIGGTLVKKTVDAYNYFYKVGPAGSWQMVVADEEKTVQANVVTNIKINKIVIPEESIIFPCSVMRHALGFVVSVVSLGKPKKIEEQRIIDEVLFYPIHNGMICKGDLLGVMNVLYAHPEHELLEDSVISWLKERCRY
ncbi:MAG: DUF22 domain-containing protein [Nitrososphaerota archaeon]|nr:DUF22 domain-containing protein [Nitrososphaerales archaeon]MDW8045442.1 DUF22 domain-containing protein [Nitrososphaerota archaeon]